jgi:hypothetical protein
MTCGNDDRAGVRQLPVMVRIPRAAPAVACSGERHQHAPAAGVQPLALVVEGAAPLGSALVGPMAAHGWRTIVARGAEDALAIAGDHPLDVLVAEFRLGATSGEDLAVSLRRDRPSLPVVLVSGLQHGARIELWPPAAFMPRILRADSLVATICTVVEP